MRIIIVIYTDRNILKIPEKPTEHPGNIFFLLYSCSSCDSIGRYTDVIMMLNMDINYRDICTHVIMTLSRCHYEVIYSRYNEVIMTSFTELRISLRR